MHFNLETPSTIKTRSGFHDPGELVRPTPDTAKSVIRSFSERDDSRDGLSRSFDLPEDPSFWKDHNVQVIIRLRPLSSSEISLQGYNKCVRQESHQTITWTGHPESRFTFDLVADENVSQEKLFKVAGIPMVENCVGGYNSCMFAYGQTGSGKTHTMLGDIEGGTRRHSVNCGMTPRVFEYLFSRIQKEKEARRDEKLRFICKCSFLEIYNEHILDLLNPSSVNLQIREDLKKGVYVENLTELEVTSAREVMNQLLEGATNRKVAATNMNLASSRSHSVFTCAIESTWESQGVTHHRFARLNLVDLAGSERQKSSGAEGDRLKEATNINKSLSTLGLVIMNLVSISNGKSLHVPYRDSKLTFLLQDSLGGNSKTIIIANISPSNCCSLETLSTLKFAQRAKFIKNNAIVNEDASGDVLAMRMQIQQLKKEVSHLQGLLNGGDVNQDMDTLSTGFLGSPGNFKWDGLHGISSPLTSDKRMPQKKEYEAALVGALRREKDKDTALQSLAAENQAAMQLAKQRADEIQSLKLRLRFRESGIKRLEAVASGKMSAEAHLSKEKEELLKEIEVLRAQVDRNQEVTRFAMENLRLKEEIRRLKSFFEEGERERMTEQITILQNKLLEALDWKLMHEPGPSNVQELASPWQSSMKEENEFLHVQAIQNQAGIDSLQKKLDLCIEEKAKLERHLKDMETELENLRSSKAMEEETKTILVDFPSTTENTVQNVSCTDQTELKAMVDAIAAASQREAEAHEMAISLSKENDELRAKVKVLLEDNNKLIDLYERAVAESNSATADGNGRNGTSQNNDVDLIANEEVTEANKNIGDLENQLVEMHEENEKLMSLYEKAMHERDEKVTEADKKIEDLKGQLVEMHDENERLLGLYEKAMLERDEKVIEAHKHREDLKNQLAEMREENENLMGLYEKATHERGEKVAEANKKIEDLDNQLAEKVAEANKKIEDLDNQLAEMHEKNEKLISLYEKAMCEREEVTKANNSSAGDSSSNVQNNDIDLIPDEEVTKATQKIEDLENQLKEMHKENEKLMGLYEKATHERDEFKQVLSSGRHQNVEDGDFECPEKLVEAHGGEYHDRCEGTDEFSCDNEDKMEEAKDETKVRLLEKSILEACELLREIEATKDAMKFKQQEIDSLKLLSSTIQERRALNSKKFSALRFSLSNFSSSIAYFEQRQLRAISKVNASTCSLNQHKGRLARLETKKDEIELAKMKLHEEEATLRNDLACLKSRLEEETRKQERERVLFSIDNVDKIEVPKLGSKATELLKSEEEKTRLQNEIKQSREKLSAIKKQTEDLNKKARDLDNEIDMINLEIAKSSKNANETRLALQKIVNEKEILLEMRENGKVEIDDMIVETQQCMFEELLKEEEMKVLEEEMQVLSRKLVELEIKKCVVLRDGCKID